MQKLNVFCPPMVMTNFRWAVMQKFNIFHPFPMVMTNFRWAVRQKFNIFHLFLMVTTILLLSRESDSNAFICLEIL